MRYPEQTLRRSSRIVLLIAALSALVALDVHAPQAREVVGHGDFDFYLDTVAFRGREGRVVAEVNVRIPNNEIKFRETSGSFESRLKFSVLVTDLDGKAVIEDAEEMIFREEAEDRTTSSLFFQTVIKRYHLDPGVYLLSYAIEDLEATKTTMMARVRGKNAKAMIRRMRFDLPEIPPDVPSFSEAKFVWDIEESGSEGRREYHPNPPRVYGLYKDTLMVYMELYLPEEMANAPTFEFQSVIADAKGEEVQVSRIDLTNPGPGVGGDDGAYPVLLREDLNQLTAGVYSLYVSFHLDGRRLSRIHAGSFSVAWDLRTWEVPRREMLAEARFLLGDQKFEEFVARPPGEQESMLDALWKGADPSPETGENEAYETFLARLEFANEHYSDFGPAVFDPRGQLYMRLGPPDEIIQDVIPLNRETVSEAVQLIEDRYHPVSFSTHGVKLYSGEAKRSNVVDPRELGVQRAGDNVAYPFELWVYHTSGEAILERDRLQEADIGMRYLFIDREGYGRYKLESSSSISTK